MKSHRDGRRRAALVLALAACAALAAPAAAEPGADYPQGSGARTGATPADLAQRVVPAPKSGDTPADFPGASRAPEYQAPTIIEIVRPERTIVREVDQVLPTVLAALALVVALGSAGFALIRTRSPKSGVVGGSDRRPGGAHPGAQGPARASSPRRARRAPAAGTAPPAPDGATGRTHNTKEPR
jgi:hypothetical protein